MTVELAPEVEQAILAEAEATGRTPDEVANKHLAALVNAAEDVPEITVASLLATIPPDEAAIQRANASIERLRELREDIGPSFGPRPAQRFRSWIHEGHKHY
jgi:hypothetical protein